MVAMLPEAKEYKKGSGKTKEFNRIGIVVKNAAISIEEMIALLEMKLWNYPEIGVCASTPDEDGCLILVLKKGLDGFECENKELFLKQGYILDIRENSTEIIFEQQNGLVNGLSTLKQLFKNAGDRYYMDGEVVRTLSIDLAVEAGADVVIISNVYRPHVGRVGSRSLVHQGGLAVARQALNTILNEKEKRGIDLIHKMYPQIQVLVVSPDLGRLPFTSRLHARAMLRRGYRDALRTLAKAKRRGVFEVAPNVRSIGKA